MNNVTIKRVALYTAGVIVVLLGLQLWYSLRFHVVNVNPSLRSVSTISPFLKVSFNKALVPGSVKITASPTSAIGTPVVAGKVITIPLVSPLQIGHPYSVTIAQVTSVSGKTITNKTFTFKPRFISSADLPADQRQALLKAQTNNKTNTADPILKHIPYKTTDFQISQDVNPQKNQPKNFPLLVTVVLAGADMGNQAAAAAQHKQEALDYITSLGLNPNNYSITYIVQLP